MAAKQKHNLFWAGAAAVGIISLYSMKRRKDKPSLFIKDWLPFGFNAMTVAPLGIFVTKDQANNQNLLTHELAHWKQFQDMGLVRFYVCGACQLAANGYDGSPMEQQARKAAGEDDFVTANYTECVRMGIARTVHNPDFRR